MELEDASWWPAGDCRCAACGDMRLYFGDDDRGRRLAAKIRVMYWAGTISSFERRWLRKHPPRWWASCSQNGRRSPVAGRYGPSARKEVLGAISFK